MLCGWGSTIWMFVGSVFYPTPPEFLRVLPRSTDDCSDMKVAVNNSKHLQFTTHTLQTTTEYEIAEAALSTEIEVTLENERFVQLA